MESKKPFLANLLNLDFHTLCISYVQHSRCEGIVEQKTIHKMTNELLTKNDENAALNW